MPRLWSTILGHVLGPSPADRNVEHGPGHPPGATDGPAHRPERFEPYIRARLAADPSQAVYDVTLEGVNKPFHCKADAISYCSSRMVRLGLNP